MANDQRPTTNDVVLYYITDRTAFGTDESTRCRRLLEKMKEAVRAEVDYIQLREKDLSTRELESLARDAVGIIRQQRIEKRELKTALLMNSRVDIALAVGADGVHLRSDDISPTGARSVWASCARDGQPDLLIGVSCHSPVEVAQAETNGATFAVFAPVFEKRDAPNTQPAGLVTLREACKVKIPVLALGGITVGNANSCLQSGASGIAAIRLFQENDVSRIVKRLRESRF